MCVRLFLLSVRLSVSEWCQGHIVADVVGQGGEQNVRRVLDTQTVVTEGSADWAEHEGKQRACKREVAVTVASARCQSSLSGAEQACGEGERGAPHYCQLLLCN